MKHIYFELKGQLACRILYVVILLLGNLTTSWAYNNTYNVNVGETFTVYTTPKTYTQSVLWSYDWSVVEPVGYIGSATTNVTFRAIAPSPSVGIIIQAITYYHQNGTTSTGINKSVDDWKVVVKDNSTVSLNQNSMTLDPGESQNLYATASRSSYSGNYSWKSDNNSVAYISGGGSSVRIIAKGTGKTKITVTLDNGSYASCEVNVRSIDVETATVTPESKKLDIDETANLSLSLTPSNATVTSRQWKSKDTGVATVNSSGVVTGVSQGNTEIYCIVNGSVVSSSCTLTVSKPAFIIQSSLPSENAVGQSVFVKPSVTFNRQIYKGTAFSKVKLYDDNNKEVSGTASTDACVLTFSPIEPLDPNATYSLTVPELAVKDKYGSSNKGYELRFLTGNLQKLALWSSIKDGFLPKNTEIDLQSDGSGVSIYYTIDGSTPDKNSTLYSNAIVLESDIRLRAIAIGAGYENSDVFSQDYFISNVSVTNRYPNDNVKLFEYKDVNPYVRFSNDIVQSNNINDVTLKKSGTGKIDCEVLVADSTIFIIPSSPLESGCSYQVAIPADAVRTAQGEPNGETSWNFNTGNYATGIAMGGPELGMAFKTDGSLQTWGEKFSTGNPENGSYSMILQLVPSAYITENIKSVSSGYMHHAMIKSDGSLWMWGRQYCGEFGNMSTSGSSVPVKVWEDVDVVSCGGQSTAIVLTDGSLWMCGRNDYGQIGDGSVVNRNEPVRILDNVKTAVAGWCVTYAILNDGSLMAWGRNDMHQLGLEQTEDQLRPTKLMDNVSTVATSTSQNMWSAAIKDDGTLWIWGEKKPVPEMLLDNVMAVSVGDDFVLVLKNDNTLWGFGSNSRGQLGKSQVDYAETLVKITDNVYQVASGSQTSTVLMQNGSVWSWGRNDNGILGNGTAPSLTAFSNTPSQIIEGRSSSVLSGIASRKHTYRIIEGSRNVIDAVPVPSDAVYDTIFWQSEDDDIATVSNRGIITAISVGETYIKSIIKDKNGTVYETGQHVIVEDPTWIGNIFSEKDNPSVWVERYQIHVQGIMPGQRIELYNSSGSTVLRAVANVPYMVLPVSGTGVFVVRIDNYCVKVVL